MPIVTNKITLPSGTLVSKAIVDIRLIVPGWVTSLDKEILGPWRAVTADDGTWTVTLEANANIAPANTYYEVTETVNSKSTRYNISVPTSAGPHWAGDILVASPAALGEPGFPVTLNTAQTITGEKTFDNDMVVRGHLGVGTDPGDPNIGRNTVENQKHFSLINTTGNQPYARGLINLARRGTLQADDHIGTIDFIAIQNLGLVEMATIQADIEGSGGSGGFGAGIHFMTKPDNSATFPNRLWIHADGNIGMGNRIAVNQTGFSSAKVFTIQGDVARQRSAIELVNVSPQSPDALGTVAFLSRVGAVSTRVAQISGEFDTSATGGALGFYTKSDAGSLTERIRVKGDGVTNFLFAVGFGSATAPAYPVDVRIDQNTTTTARVANQSAGSTAVAQLRVENDRARGLAINVFSTGHSAGGQTRPDSAMVRTDTETTNGLTLTTRAGALRLGTLDTDRLEISAANPADGETAMLIQRNVGGTFTLQRVSMGAVDSGGAGHKVLRVAN